MAGVFAKPTEGEINCEYAKDNLIYSPQKSYDYVLSK